jgi:phage-related protein
MPISLTKTYLKGEYQSELEASINSSLSTLSASVTTLSGNVTSLNDFIAVSAVDTAVFTLDLTTYRNFTVTCTETAGKTLKIANAPTASDTMLNVNVKLTFSATATVTYTGTITWSVGTAAVTAAPDPSAAGTFLLNLKSFDAGANWLATYQGLY